MNQDELKQLVGTKAVEWIKDGMIVGLGTGSTELKVAAQLYYMKRLLQLNLIRICGLSMKVKWSMI